MYFYRTLGRTVRSCSAGDTECRASASDYKGEHATNLVHHFKLRESNMATKRNNTRMGNKQQGRNTKATRRTTTSGSPKTDNTSNTRAVDFADRVNDTVLNQEVKATKIISRANVPSKLDVTDVFPAHIDLFVSDVTLYPAGSSNTLVQEHFEEVIAPKMLHAIRQSLNFAAATPITTTHLRNYINTVTQAYMTLVSVHQEMNVCYHSVGSNSLSRRFENIFDESVVVASVKLANALNNFYLPTGTLDLVHRLSKFYFTDQNIQAPYFQFSNYDRTDTASGYVSLLNTVRATLLSLTNVDVINTAFGSPRFSSDYFELTEIDTSSYQVREEYLLSDINIEYNSEMLDIWLNQMLYAYDSTTTFKSSPNVTDAFEKIVVFTSSNELTQLSNALTTVYDGNKVQPGLLSTYSAGANSSNFNYIDASGDIQYITYNSTDIAYRLLAKAANGWKSATIASAMRPAGTGVLYTNLSNKMSDCEDILQNLY